MMKFTLAIALGIAMGAPAFAQTAGTNACSSGPCQNGGICATTPSTPSGYTCTCLPGYYGVTCGNKAVPK